MKPTHLFCPHPLGIAWGHKVLWAEVELVWVEAGGVGGMLHAEEGSDGLHF